MEGEIELEFRFETFRETISYRVDEASGEVGIVPCLKIDVIHTDASQFDHIREHVSFLIHQRPIWEALVDTDDQSLFLTTSYRVGDKTLGFLYKHVYEHAKRTTFLSFVESFCAYNTAVVELILEHMNGYREGLLEALISPQNFHIMSKDPVALGEELQVWARRN